MATNEKKVVIVGSGLGGLLCGAILVKKGYHVTVIEKNKQIGGSLQIFSREKKVIDTGVHYIGSLTPGENLYKIFKYAGIVDDLKLEQLDMDCFDEIVFENDPVGYPLAQTYELFAEKLAEIFPEERENLRAFAQAVESVCLKVPVYNLVPSLMEQTDILWTSAYDFINSHIKDPKLRAVLAGNVLLHAGQKDKTSVFAYCIILDSYIKSTWKCVGGGSQIAIALAKQIKKNGLIIRNTEVTELVNDDVSVSGVRTAKGEFIKADIIISNIHPDLTYKMLDTHAIKPIFRKRIKALSNSISAFSLYIILDPATYPYTNHNIYMHLTDHPWQATEYGDSDWPTTFGVFFTKDPKNPDYCETINLISYMKFEDVQEWEETFNTVNQPTERGEDYENFKTNRAELMLDIFEKRFGEIRPYIKKYYTSTPLTYRDYIYSPEGSMYGIVKDCRNPLQSILTTRTKISNLYITGQNILLHGICGTTMTALLTIGEITGLPELMEEINNQPL